jgi:hypothetical protein
MLSAGDKLGIEIRGEVFVENCILWRLKSHPRKVGGQNTFSFRHSDRGGETVGIT